jgi:hypothetical protein
MMLERQRRGNSLAQANGLGKRIKYLQGLKGRNKLVTFCILASINKSHGQKGRNIFAPLLPAHHLQVVEFPLHAANLEAQPAAGGDLRLVRIECSLVIEDELQPAIAAQQT